MPKQVFVGFDSAWTDNRRNPGAVAALVCEDSQTRFLPPRLTSFNQAAAFIAEVRVGADYLLVAVDQPIVVPNEAGCRPVERVAASLISRLGGGVQPARRGGGGCQMFGDAAPIWSFLHAVGGAQDPFSARVADQGAFVMEVFPALALPALIPEIWKRGRAAKYNPAARLYDSADWILVARGAADAALQLGETAISQFLLELAGNPRPGKGDQDRLDAVICLLIALTWRRRPSESCVVLGEVSSGYIVTPVSAATRTVLEASARRRDVPVDQPWSDQARSVRPEVAATRFAPVVSLSTSPQSASLRTGRARPDPVGELTKATISAGELRPFLIEKARTRQPVTYGEVAQAFGFPWTQGFGASLKAALGAVNDDNLVRGEPMLMALVVNKESRLPGQGYYDLVGEGAASQERRRELLELELLRCSEWSWS